MEITEVKVFPVQDKDDKRRLLMAYATIVFDGEFIVRNLKVIKGEQGLFVSMPSQKRKDGSFKDIAHPLNSGMRRKIEERVIEEYMRVMQMMGDDHQKMDMSQIED